MKIAIVGAGIAGLTSAWKLARDHQVTLFEAESRPGGHTHTHSVEVDGTEYRVDSGFIVFNGPNYPGFNGLLDELGVASQATAMSFAVRNDRTGLEYNATDLAGLFVQPGNMISRRFWRMLRDIFRFYKEAPLLLAADGPGPSTAEYLDAGGYSEAFRDDHLMPMASALWSAPLGQVGEFPMQYMVRFFDHHRMLQAFNRPEWRVVQGGSRSYVDALLERCPATLHLATPIARIERDAEGVDLVTGSGDRFRADAVILACHSDQALALLAEPSEKERQVLGAIRFHTNDVALHTDTGLLPKKRRAWAAWNALVTEDADAPCTVSYDMNILQSIRAPVEFVVTLNQTDRIDPARIIERMTYHHPVYCEETVAAQQRKHEINGVDRTWYCGAYWGWGFHEDGVRSALDVAAALQDQSHA